MMYLDAVGIDISNNQDKCCKVKPFRSQTKYESAVVPNILGMAKWF